MTFMKDVCFVGGSLDDLKRFPAGARREAGFELSNVQAGLQPSNWKPMNTVGAGAVEIRIKDKDGMHILGQAEHQFLPNVNTHSCRT